MNRRTFAGLPVVVENPAGSVRQWHDRDGRVSGSTEMKHDYGFIEDQVGPDGDEVDCYLGPDEAAPMVYVVHQNKAPDYQAYDEDKVMLGFADEATAKQAYLAHRNDGERAYGGMTVMSLERFKAKLSRRTGTGKIRHERGISPWTPLLDWVRQVEHALELEALVTFTIVHRADGWHVLSEDETKHLGGPYATEGEAKERLRQVEAHKHEGIPIHLPPGAIFADGCMFDVARGVDGKIRVGMWDRGMTPGKKVKNGVETEFNADTFGQMIDNWKRRGEHLALCYNHQSAYVEQNGQPAPALAFYTAIAVVEDGRVTRFEKLASSPASEPDVAQLRAEVARLATDENPNPSPDGCWFFRGEVTPIGEQLLPGFKYLSPMFVPAGRDEQGNEIGYTLYDLAATNTAFQSGCLINFNRITQEEINMPGKLSKLAKFVKMEENAEDKAIRQGLLQKMEDEAAAAMDADEGYSYDDAAGRLEEMAKAYEDAHFEEESDEDKKSPPHVAMRRYAAKFRRMSKMGAAGGEPGGEDEKAKEAMQRLEAAQRKEITATMERLKIPVPQGASVPQLFEALRAGAVGAASLPAIVDDRVRAALKAQEETRTIEDTKAKAKVLMEAAAEGGYLVDEEQKAAFLTFASNPKTYAAAEAMARPHLKKEGPAAIMLQRFTGAGAPLSVDARHMESGGADRRIVRMDVLQTDATVFGEKLSAMAIEMADSVEPKVRARIDAMLGEGVKGSKYEAFERLNAAYKVLKKDRPDLQKAAEESYF